MANKKICVRCESLDRPQQSKRIYKVKNNFGDEVPICAVCLREIAEEEEYLKSLEENDAEGNQEFD